jgi:hypothetical protein
MNINKHPKSYDQCYYLATKIVDEAIFIYKHTKSLSPDFCVCKCSMQRAMAQIKSHFENNTELKFICISFRDLMEITNIYVNAEFIKNKIK